MSQENTEPQSVETSEEDVEIFIADPEDYQKTKKLEAIHTAKEAVSEHYRNRTEKIAERRELEFEETANEVYRLELAQLVAQYGSELLPLIEEGIENDVIDEGNLLVVESPPNTIADVVVHEGHIKEDGEFRGLTPQESMIMYRQLQRIQRDLGLGLDIELDEGPAKI